MTRRGRALSAFLAALAMTGCMHAARIFLDLESLQESGAPDEQAAVPEGFVVVPGRIEPPPPPIESITDLDSVLLLLPSHLSGGVDWAAAVREGVIRPRAGTRAGTTGSPDSLVSFGYDLYLRSGGGPEAFFPHSEHQQWLSCQSCHPKVYRRGPESLTPETAHEATSCAFCHGDVAFPIRACERCHEAAADLPEGRIEKSLGEALTMERFGAAQFTEERRRTGREDLSLVTAYPPARFPHGEHRLRYECRACHERPFPMQRGATVLTQAEAHGGGACGACHNGVVAFDTGLNECFRCHVESAPSEG